MIYSSEAHASNQTALFAIGVQGKVKLSRKQEACS